MINILVIYIDCERDHAIGAPINIPMLRNCQAKGSIDYFNIVIKSQRGRTCTTSARESFFSQRFYACGCKTVYVHVMDRRGAGLAGLPQH